MDKSSPNSRSDPLDDWYRAYRKPVYYRIQDRLGCSREEAEDRTSEVFRRAARRLKGGGKPVENPKQWLFSIADSVCADYYRVNTGEYQVVSDHYISSEGEERSLFDDLECAADELPEVVSEKHALWEEAMKYLSELPPKQRKAIELRYLKGWHLEQIANEMGTSLGTTRRAIDKGIGQLRVRLVQWDLQPEEQRGEQQ